MTRGCKTGDVMFTDQPARRIVHRFEIQGRPAMPNAMPQPKRPMLTGENPVSVLLGGRVPNRVKIGRGRLDTEYFNFVG